MRRHVRRLVGALSRHAFEARGTLRPRVRTAVDVDGLYGIAELR